MTSEHTTRRRLLQFTAAAVGSSVAGCLNDRIDPASGGSDDDPSGPNDVPSLETEYNSRERFASPGERFDPLEDESKWSAVAGTVDTDTETVFEGSQSLRLTGEGGSNVGIERTLSGADLSDVDLSFAIRTTTPDDIAVYLRLFDDYGNDAILELRRISFRGTDAGWFRTCPGVFETSDPAPDLTRVQRLQLVVSNAGSDTVEVWVDDLRSHEKPDKGYVVLSWDDGKRAYYDEAAPIQDEFGFPAVMAAVPRFTGQPNFMSTDQLTERQQAGDQIILHESVDNSFHELDRDQLEQILATNKQWFIDNEFEGANFIVYPGNNFDAAALDVLSRYHYVGGMNQASRVNTTGVRGFDPLALPRTIGHDLDIAKTVVDRTAEHRNCGILNFHDFAVANTMDKEEYRSLLTYIEDTDGVEVITLDDLWEMRTEAQ
jgi:peptidoglycan/xylan/chitin deacetylase (PgdA/CDA1 family)